MREVVVVVLAIVFLVVFWPSSINGDTDPSDAAAMRIMFSSLNLPPQLTKWSSSNVDPCGESWKGITCSGSRVAEIKLSGLGLTGSMGYQLSSLTAVTNFDMSNNNLRNQIPYQLPPKVQQLYALNLADNGFSGDIPYSISQMTSLKHLNLSHNQLQGQLSDMFGKLSALSTLDLSFNYLTGTLPESFNSLSSMTNMYLQNNQFTGTIDILSSLPLKNLNVENNHFGGLIPDQLKNINIQKDGNSQSSGPAPQPPSGTSPASGADQNHESGSNYTSDGADSGGVSKKLGMGVGVIVGVVISILVVGALVAFFVMKRRPSKSSTDVEKLNQHFAPLASPEMQETRSIQTSSIVNTKMYGTSASVNPRDPPIDPHESFHEDHFSRKSVVTKKVNTTLIDAVLYSIADLQMATDNFNIENLVGEGSTGCVFRAHFPDGKVVAVKKIISSDLSNHMSEDFMDIVSHVSKLHHPNITNLVGYCSEHGQNLLVFEFQKNGSLHDWLHLCDEYRRPLIWNSRVKIALGTARALEYLHEVYSPSVVHKNLKSANILLDGELNPLLSDSGLASLVSGADQTLNYNVGFGYGAPEVAMSGQYTIKSDIYSFGVVMLELLTGRKPFDSSRPGTEQSLVQWATPQLHDIDALLKMVDPALEGLYPVKSLSHFAEVIALCVQTLPEFRPSMSEVVQALVMLLQRSSMSRRTFGKEFNYLP